MEEDRDNLTYIEGDNGKDFFTYAKEALGHTPLEVNFKKLNKDAVTPTYAHDGDVGMDFTAISVEYDANNDMYIYHTGLAFETEKHYGAFLFPRSSNRKTDAYLCNHVGIADTAIYRGEIMFCYKNRTSLEVRAELERMRFFLNDIAYKPFTISNGDRLEFTWAEAGRSAASSGGWIYDNPMNFAPYKVGDRIGQMVVLPYPEVKLIEKMELSDTVRGDNGFGSTGN
jgi:dUTP pyrophosphatase